MFTTQELKTLQTLINLVPIKGADALPVALLQQKIAQNLQASEITEVKKEKTSK